MSGWAKKRKVMQRYDLTAHLYDMRYAEEQAEKYKSAIRNLKTKKFGLVLDAGCGTGLLFDHIIYAAKAIVGLDISRKILLMARNRSRSLNVQLIRADVDTMPFKDAVFNCVFAVTVLQNIPDQLETLAEIKRVSKDNSSIIVTGLKRIFSKRRFEALLKDSDLKITALEEGDDLRCYVAVCAKIRH
jgi:malonyl-CoA O-methyltransferase